MGNVAYAIVVQKWRHSSKREVETQAQKFIDLVA